MPQQTIRKTLISEFGDESKVSVVNATIEDPTNDEVQCKVIYAGFSQADISMRRGMYPLQKKAPLTPGYCFVGRVDRNGPNASKFRKGDMVCSMTKYDSEAELINVQEKYLYLVPEGVDLKQAVGLVLDWNTAYAMVHHSAQVKPGQKVFVHGMSGAVGYATFCLSVLAGAEVYGTASQRNHAMVIEKGGKPFVYTDKKWMDEMKRIGGVDVVFDPIGFESFDESWDILAKGGLVLGYGTNKDALEGRTPPRNPMTSFVALYAKNLKFSCKRGKFYGITKDDKDFGPDLEALFKLNLAGDITVPIRRVFQMDTEDVRTAHREFNKGGLGSTIMVVNEKLI